MNWNDFRLRLRALVFRHRVEQELREEIEQHIDLETRKNLRLGLNELEARRQAVIKFGGTAQFAEQCRDERRVTLIEQLIQDLGYGCRMFRRSPIFTTVAVLLLALGIGATTSIFSLAYRVMQESLPVKQPADLVELYNEDVAQRRFQAGLSYPGFQLLSQQNPVFSEMFAFSDTFRVNVVRHSVAEFGEAAFQTTNMDSALGLSPSLGRLINETDGLASTGNPPAVLSFRYWQKRFGGDPKVIGETIAINNNAFVVVGVAQRGFNGMILGVSPDVILPLQVVERVRRVPVLNNAASLGFHVIGRRKPDLTLQQIHDSLQPLYRSVIDQFVSSIPPAFASGVKGTVAKWQLRVRPADRGTNSEVQANLNQSLTILVSITALVFLIGCTNLAGLLITRTEVRAKELHTRLAIGCSRGRLMRQMITESMLLAAMGGVAGLAMSLWTRPVLLTLLTEAATAIDITLDATTPILASALSILAGLLMGLAPALTARRISKKSFTTELSRFNRSKGRRALVVAQVAASVVLLVIAGQFGLSLENYRGVRPGFRSDHLVLFETSVRARSSAYAQQVRERISQLPGVVAVSHSSSPVGQLNWTTPIQVPGFQSSSPGDNWTGRNVVGPRFVETLGLQLISGRDIDSTDTQDRPRVAVVNEAFANHFFNGQDPIGRTFTFIDSVNSPQTIVGVVKNATDRGIKTPAGPVTYSSFEHDPLGGMTFVVRVNREPEDVMAEIAIAVRQVDPSVPVGPIRSMDTQVEESLQRERMLASLSSAFSGLATVVAAIGVYGVLAYMVTRRTREIAVRIAVGAKPAQVRWLTLRETGLLIFTGTLIGIPLSLAMSWTIRSQLFGIQPGDPRAMGIAVAIVFLFAIVASWVPTYRASRLDPVAALKVE